jgi:hypothetical protein
VVCAASKPLVEVLKTKGSKTPVEMSNAFMCITLDSIAQWGFGVDMKAVQSLPHMDQFPMVEVGFSCPALLSRYILPGRYSM